LEVEVVEGGIHCSSAAVREGSVAVEPIADHDGKEKQTVVVGTKTNSQSHLT
jgi:hypothetical protein